MTVAEFIGLNLLVFGIFIAGWFSIELAHHLRDAVFQSPDGDQLTRAGHEHQFWNYIYLEAFLIVWGVAWALVGLLETLGVISG